MWHSTAKAIYLNLTLDGQLWVESCGSDVVGGKLDPSGTAGAFTSKSGCIMVVLQMRLSFAYRGLSAPLTTSDVLVHVAL